MAADERDTPAPGSARDEVTEEAATVERRPPSAYAVDVPVAEPIDPWMDLTPSNVQQLAELGPALPGFVAEADTADGEITGAEVPLVASSAPHSFADELRTHATPQWLADDLDEAADLEGTRVRAYASGAAVPTGPAAPPEWIESEEVEAFEGDGPFAAPVDAPPRGRGASRFAEALRADPVRRAPVAPPAPEKALVPAAVKAELDRPHRLERRATSVAGPQTVADIQRVSRPRAPAPAQPERPVRHYPLVRALLQDPDSVPYGIEPPTEPAAPPVPGTFFPVRREPPPRPDPVELDKLLLTMAEGLLIGEGTDGGTEVRVTLRDEFFAGTELRIAIGDGRVSATLVPPDRNIYWQLSGHVSDLEARLSERGLRVQEIRILEPGS